MTSTLRALTTLLPPPQSPTHNHGDWALVEAEVGCTLPDDFKEFTEIYGCVSISGCLWLHSPFYYVGEGAFQPLLGHKQSYIELLMSALKSMDEVVDGRANVPFPDFPAPRGLLPIGATDNGDVIAWITDGEPNNWGTFFWAFPGLNTFSFPALSLTGLLLEIATQKSPLFPSALGPTFFSPENLRVESYE